ncbi:MAG TPA: hypothetical protein VGM56_09265 [Byssovorax sp.]|jgi:hypothetical protein
MAGPCADSCTNQTQPSSACQSCGISQCGAQAQACLGDTGDGTGANPCEGGGTGGGGGAGGGSAAPLCNGTGPSGCVTCSDLLLGGKDPNSLCPGSAADLNDVETCTCDPSQPCATPGN